MTMCLRCDTQQISRDCCPGCGTLICLRVPGQLTFLRTLRPALAASQGAAGAAGGHAVLKGPAYM